MRTTTTGHGERRYSAERVRQGEIILRSRTQRWIFLAGLIGIILLALIGSLWLH